MHYRISVTNGILDMEYENLQEAIQTSATEAYVRVCTDVEPRLSWVEITEDEWNTVKASLPYTTPVKMQTAEEQFSELKENQLILMDAIATLFETMIGVV